MTSVLIVVLNWNGIKDTEKCLNSLLQQTHQNFKILVVDNGSIDDSLERLHQIKKKNENISVISNRVNKGFAGGVNTGITYALKNDFDSIALFNNDAIADKEWLSSLVKKMEDKKVGIATGLLLHADGKTIDSTGEFYSKWGLMFPRNRDDNTDDAPVDGSVFGASGGASLYRSELFKDIGLFDERFFVYFEDADISFRAQLAGWKIVYEPKAIAYHEQGATSKKVPGMTIFYYFRNIPLIFVKDVPTKLLLPIGIRFYLVYWILVGNAIANGNGWPAIKGAFSSLPLKLLAMGERYKIQTTKRVSAKYIKSIIWDDLPPKQTGLRKLRKAFTGKA